MKIKEEEHRPAVLQLRCSLKMVMYMRALSLKMIEAGINTYIKVFSFVLLLLRLSGTTERERTTVTVYNNNNNEKIHERNGFSNANNLYCITIVLITWYCNSRDYFFPSF